MADTTSKGGLSGAMKTIAANPTETQSILQQMQQLIAERESPANIFLSGLKDASAWGAGGAEGPTQALAVRDRQKAEEAKQLFDMRTQIANLRAQEQRQQMGAQALGFGLPGQFTPQAGGAQAPAVGAAPAAGGAVAPYMVMLKSLPPSVQPMGSYLLSQGDFDGFNKLVSEHELKRPSEQKNLQFAATLSPEDRDIFMRQQFKESYRPQEYIGPDSKTYQFSLPGAMPPDMQPRAGAAPTTPAGQPTVLGQLQSSVYQTESSSGRADTTKPGVQGAIGPMQITSDTWKTFTDRGVIPKGLDINNPQHNKQAGDKILEHYFNKYNGDIDKTLAAYHGGEGAIKPDGTIDLARKDANGVSIGDYIAKNKSQITAAEPVKRKSIGEQEIEKTGATESAKQVGQEIGKIASEITNLGKSSGERELRYTDILNIVNDKDMQKVFGKLSEKGLVPFTLKQIESGAGIGQFGTIGLKDLERNLTVAGATEEQRKKFLRVEKHLKQAELEYARIYLQGQGAVSDNERRLVQQAVGSTSDPASVLKMQAGVMRQRAIFDKKMADALDVFRDKKGTYADPGAFLRSNEAKAIIREHNAQLGKVLGINVPLDSNPLQAPPGQEKQPLKNVPFRILT